MAETIKLSAPAMRGFWEIPVCFEDDSLLALDKPAGLPCAPDPAAGGLPSLTSMLHAGIAAHKTWAQQHRLSFLGLVRRLDTDASGIVLFAKSREVQASLADLFGTEKPIDHHLALVAGAPDAERFEVTAKIAADPLRPEWRCVDARNGKKSKTGFAVLEKFAGYTAVRCRPHTWREHQVRVHLQSVKLPVVGDSIY